MNLAPNIHIYSCFIYTKFKVNAKTTELGQEKATERFENAQNKYSVTNKLCLYQGHIVVTINLLLLLKSTKQTVLVLNITPVMIKVFYYACLALQIQIIAFVFTNTTHTKW